MRGGVRHIAAAALCALLMAGPGAAVGAQEAQDLPPLRENAHVWNSLLSAAIGDEIRRNCPSIAPRLFRALHAAKALERHALGLGYSEEQIEAFLESDADKARMKTQRDAYLEHNGVREGDPDSYCQLGRQEIARKTLTGSLLRETN